RHDDEIRNQPLVLGQAPQVVVQAGNEAVPVLVGFGQPVAAEEMVLAELRVREVQDGEDLARSGQIFVCHPLRRWNGAAPLVDLDVRTAHVADLNVMVAPDHLAAPHVRARAGGHPPLGLSQRAGGVLTVMVDPDTLAIWTLWSPQALCTT